MNSLLINRPDTDKRRREELEQDSFLFLNGYTVQRIVYELIKNYMVANPPEEVGISLGQKYDPDPTKSGIHLDVAFNWKSQLSDKVPAIYVQRGDIEVDSPTFDQATSYNIKNSSSDKLTINTMPIKISCIAAAPLAVVENLAEYVKQPLVYFKQAVKLDFKLRKFNLKRITAPVLVPESKTNFVVDILMEVAFDENWMIEKESLKMKTVALALFDEVVKGCKTCK